MTRRAANWQSRIGRQLKLRDLQVLSAVVHCGSMSKGAAQLGLSQPSVSDAIANLEAVVGVRLLDRSPRGIEPTIYAQALLKRGHIAFDELQQGLQEIEHLTDPTLGEVRLACPESLSAGFVPAVIERVTQKHPRISVYVVETQTAEQDFRELRERSVDLMLGRLLKPLTSEDVNVEVLCQDHFVVVTGAASPWATRKKIALKDLLNEQWILFPPSNVTGPYINRIFQGNGLEPPRVTVASYSMHLRLHLLSTGRFLTIVQDSVARYHAKRRSLKVLPIDTRRAPAPIAAFTLRNRTMSPVVHVFLEQGRAVARSIP
jgi:DNA-binding transcriptional LysR family regulator